MLLTTFGTEPIVVINLYLFAYNVNLSSSVLNNNLFKYTLKPDKLWCKLSLKK